MESLFLFAPRRKGNYLSVTLVKPSTFHICNVEVMETLPAHPPEGPLPLLVSQVGSGESGVIVCMGKGGTS